MGEWRDSSRMFLFFSNCSHYSQHYLADSGLFWKVVPPQLSPARPGLALSLSCISWSSPSDGSPLMPFSVVAYWWHGKVASVVLWCLNLSACAAPVQTTEDSQRTSQKVSYQLNHITMTFSGTDLILSANPGYQAFHRSFRSNTLWVWLQS